MKSTKETKSVQTPLYALTKGSGKFGAGFFGAVGDILVAVGGGSSWRCSRCGVYTVSKGSPAPRAKGKCPDTNSGNHIWELAD